MASLPTVMDTTAVGPTTPIRRKSLSDTSPDSATSDDQNVALKHAAGIKAAQAGKRRLCRLAVEKLLRKSSAKRAQHPSFKFSPTPRSRFSAGTSGRRIQRSFDDISARGSPIKKKKSGRLQMVKNAELPAHIALPEKPDDAIASVGAAAAEDPFAHAAGLKESPSIFTGFAPLAIRSRNNAKTADAPRSDVAYAAFQPLERKASGTVKPQCDHDGIANAGPSTAQVTSESHDASIERVPSQKRRKDSGGMPDTKRRRNPDEAQVNEPYGNGSVYPVAVTSFIDEPHAGPGHPENQLRAALREGINGVTLMEDETGVTLRLFFPGDPPVDAGPRGYLPQRPGQARETVQMDAKVREMARRRREEEGVATLKIDSMFATSGDIVCPESLREELLGRLPADYVDEIMGPDYSSSDNSFGASEAAEPFCFGDADDDAFGAPGDAKKSYYGEFSSSFRASQAAEPYCYGGFSNSFGASQAPETSYYGGFDTSFGGPQAAEPFYYGGTASGATSAAMGPMQGVYYDSFGNSFRVPQAAEPCYCGFDNSFGAPETAQPFYYGGYPTGNTAAPMGPVQEN
ncbi:MAG: hypothetical protein M1815_000060 [Lichina confinis]|nr:MAG: hypothetical protein M1815_000060 [Lichina confinis]